MCLLSKSHKTHKKGAILQNISDICLMGNTKKKKVVFYSYICVCCNMDNVVKSSFSFSSRTLWGSGVKIASLSQGRQRLSSAAHEVPM